MHIIQDPNPIYKNFIEDPKSTLSTLLNSFRLRRSTFDREELIDVIHRITDEDKEKISEYYDEATTEVQKEYGKCLRQHLSILSSANINRNIVSNTKFARIDRIALYCFVRVLKPEVVVETGVKWGESTFFLTEGLKKNGKGKLYSFDIGLSKCGYECPKGVDEVGFLVPEKNEEYWELIIGDAVEEMKKLLPSKGAVDLFYHDSLHTYEYMKKEFNAILPFMRHQGILMSEDIDMNDAWSEFLTENDSKVSGDFRYYSMHGIDHSTREIGASLVKND